MFKAQNINDAVKSRFSCRAFLKKEVRRGLLEEILEAAGRTPSGANTQPWELAVVSGKTLVSLKEELVQAVKSGEKPRQEFDYYPKEWFEPLKTRRYRCGMALYKALEIEREDKEGRVRQWVANYRFFEAPVALFFFVDTRLSGGALVDLGAFLQSVLLVSLNHGLGSCAQASLGYYPDIVKNKLSIPDSKKLLFGVSMGFPDMKHPVNQFRTEREPVSSFTKWFD